MRKFIYTFLVLTYISSIVTFTVKSNDYNLELIKNINPDEAALSSQFTKFKDMLYFSVDDGTHGRELWVTDGTENGTKMIKDINPGESNSNPQNFTPIGNVMYFTARDNNGNELWRTDGTNQGTWMIKDIDPDGESLPLGLIEFNGELYFTANDGSNGRELWKSDGTKVGTKILKNISENGSGFELDNFGNIYLDFLVLNDKLLFTASNDKGKELWVSDGTTIGTRIVKDINPGSEAAYPDDLFVYKNKLYFSADDGENGHELWVSDGTESGTKILNDINPTGNSLPRSFEIYNDWLFFSANDGANGAELWKTNGKPSETQLVKDINPNDGSNPHFLTSYKDNLYLVASNGSGYELWVASSSNALPFSDIVDSEDELFANFQVVDNTIFFSIFNNQTGDHKLWMTDGTFGSNEIVSENLILAEPIFGGPTNIVNYKNALYLRAGYKGIGFELWKLVNEATSVEEEDQSSISVFPIPSEDVLKIKLEEVKNLKIINNIGKKVLDLGQVLNKEVDISNLKAGVYFIADEQNNLIKKFINK